VSLIESLLIVYGGLLCINVALSALLWAKQRTPLPRNLFYVWASQVVAFVAQGLAQANDLAIVYAFSVTFFANLAVALLLARVVGLEVPWRACTAIFAVSCLVGGIVYAASGPFWMIALPVCVAVALPLLWTATQTIRKRAKALTTTGWALAVTCLAFSVHNLDFAFLRNRPEFAVAGFTIAILFAFALGTTAPAVVLEREAQERARVEELDRFKSKFFASITHELKTPLTMILASLDLMIDGELGPVTALQRSTLQATSRSGVKLLKLIGDLLDLSKLEESRLRLRIESHDLVAYLRGLLRQTEPLAERKAISVRFRSDADTVLVWCDLDRMERVFINLLSNAFKFTPPRGTVTLEVRDQGAAVLVLVSDTGPGFPAALAERIFERFYQADDGERLARGGTGIGLALARELTELHGGSIYAENRPGGGASFSVRLRKGREHFEPAALERRTHSTDKPQGKRASDVGLAGWDMGFEGRYRFIDIDQATEKRVVERDADEQQRLHTVLVVDDTPDVVRVVHLALRQHFRVFSAPDGRKGFSLALEHRPTLIITDLSMPEVDGLELTRQLREEPLTRHIPIVMLTARGDLEDRVLGLETGVSAYLAKPFAPKELLSTVRSLLSTQEKTAELVLSQQSASLESMAGGLAHEIRNPLNYIKNAVLSIQRDLPGLLRLLEPLDSLSPEARAAFDKTSARIARMFDTAQSGVKRIGGTVDLMLRYGREGYSRALEPHDVYAAIADVIEVVVPATSSDAKVKTTLEGDGTVECVPQELHQALTNLIQNALEAVSPGTGLVEVAGRVEDSELVLLIRDNGAGIKPEDQARVFTPFFTTKDVGRGLGMGLTITRRCIVALGGRISLRSQLGVGTEFTVRLPRQQHRAIERSRSES
jgi:signal transduction histidine kinase